VRTSSARVEKDSVLVETFDALELARQIGAMAASGEIVVEGLEVADESVQAVYDYLIQTGGGS
jgi:hypothetical protein